MEEYLSGIQMHPQTSSLLNKLRMYLSVARLLDYSISDEMTKVRHTVDLSNVVETDCARVPFFVCFCTQ